MTVKISIVTITFNLLKAGRRETFRQNVDSVLNQTYQNIEHIIVDGASTDGTVDLIRSCEHDRMRWVSEPDHGIYEAMNKGLHLATGDYVLYLNSDDFLCRPDGMASCARLLEETDADFLYAPNRALRAGTERVYKINEPCVGSYLVRMPFSHQALLVKRDKMLELGGFDENFKSAGDYDFVIRLINSGARGVYNPNEFSTFRDGGFSQTDGELSQKECGISYRKNFGHLCPKYRWMDMLFKKRVPNSVIQYVLKHVDKTVKAEMEKVLETAIYGKDDIWYIQEEPKELMFSAHRNQIACIDRLRLFGFMPIGKIETIGLQSVYKLFNRAIWKWKRRAQRQEG